MKKSEINILVVDDDQSIRSVMLEAIHRAGYKCVLAATPAEAHNMAKLKPIHAALIDCMLPMSNGVDLAIELKAGALENTILYLFSGIFKDKPFANEAIKKTGAVDFLYKPLDIKAVIESLDEQLQHLVDAPKAALHALLSKPFASQRERRKAIDHVEEIFGLDLPLIIFILMDAESSGYLNIVDEQGGIFGMTFAEGKILSLDGENTRDTVEKILVNTGFLTSADFENLTPDQLKGDLLKNLAAANIISPHAVTLVKGQQISMGLQQIILPQKVQINFVPDRKLKAGENGVDIETIAPILHDMIDKNCTIDWFRNFYKSWYDHPMRLGPQFMDKAHTTAQPALIHQKELIDHIVKEPTIEELIKESASDELEVYKAVHFMALRRIIVFDEFKRNLNHEEQLSRLQTIFKDIEKKNPMEIFHYFGADVTPKQSDVVRIYKEFAKANHPDTISPHAPEELKAMANKVFSLVTEAHNVLTNDEKRIKVVQEIKHREAEKQLKAEEYLERAVIKIRTRRFAEAVKDLQEAEQLFSTPAIVIHKAWARLKLMKEKDSAQLNLIEKELESVPHDHKKTSLFLLVSGIAKGVAGDMTAAEELMQKALQIDSGFLDARRELSQLKSQAKAHARAAKAKSKANDILTGDITSIVSNFFKGRKSK